MAHGFQEVLVFEVAGQRFGLPGAIVRELLRAVLITPLSPGGARLVEGIINIRGQLVPVFNVRQWLRLPAKSVEPSDHIVVILIGEHLAALRVDRALDLARLEVNPVETTDVPPDGDGGDQIAKAPAGLILLPDVHALLAKGESSGLERSLATAHLTTQGGQQP